MKIDQGLHDAIKQIRTEPSAVLDRSVHAAIDRKPQRSWRGVWKLSVAAILIMVFTLPQWNKAIAWTDVLEQFKSVEFVKASMLVKEDYYCQPEHLELWLGRGGHIKVVTGSVTVLARQGQPIKAYDTVEQCLVEPSKLVVNVINKIDSSQGFSLDMLIKTVSLGTLDVVSPSLNDKAMVAKDLKVFEGPSGINDGTVRICALRGSQLPVSFRAWDPMTGQYFEASISYPPNPGSDFFFRMD